MNTLLKKLTVVGAGFTFIIFWLAFMLYILPKLVIMLPYGNMILTPTGAFFFGCILAPLWEELAFRHAPLQIAKKFKNINLDLTIPIIILSSALFGWGHGMGPISIMIQGVGGLILSAVYISTNYNYWCSTFLHFLWNFSLLYVFPTFVGQYGIKVW